MKLRVVELLLISTIPAMALAERGLPPLGITVATLLGGTLAAGSANAFNQVIEKDLDELAVKISRERSKREIKPALKVLKEVSSIQSDNTEAEKHFVDQTTKLYDFVLKADNVLDKITEYKDNWLAKLVVKIMK